MLKPLQGGCVMADVVASGRWKNHNVNYFNKTIKEALYIRVNDPSLNRNVGKYHLPHVWDEVLFNTSELKLK